MSKCTLSIVECLRLQGIEPLATASSERSASERAATALVYNKNAYFHTTDSSSWWKVDFKKTVSINMYQIQTNSGCHYVKKWRILLSNNDVDWSIVHEPPEGYPQGKNYTLSKTYAARYFKIERISGCTKMAFHYIKFFGSTTRRAHALVYNEHTVHNPRPNNYYVLLLMIVFCF